MARRLQFLRRLSARERALFAQLVLFSATEGVAVRVIGLAHLIRFISRYVEKPWAAWFPVYHNCVAAERLAQLVDLATAVTHGEGRCLARSLALFWLLKARGESPELVIGVSKESSIFSSHAWVVLSGLVMGDRQEVPSRFVPILRF